MGDPKHTPDPWIVVTDEDWAGATVKDAYGRIVAVCEGCDIPGTPGEVSIAEAKANAERIAAIPELRRALEKYGKHLPNCIGGGSGGSDCTCGLFAILNP